MVLKQKTTTFSFKVKWQTKTGMYSDSQTDMKTDTQTDKQIYFASNS